MRKGESSEGLTPVIRRRGRGKPFPKNNRFGLATRFRKGVCPNPGGRPKSREINSSSREFLASDVGNPPLVQTNAQAIVAKIGRQARKGDLGAATFLAERAEGRPATSLTVKDGDNLELLLLAMTQEYNRVGPEDSQPLLEEGQPESEEAT